MVKGDGRYRCLGKFDDVAQIKIGVDELQMYSVLVANRENELDGVPSESCRARKCKWGRAFLARPDVVHLIPTNVVTTNLGTLQVYCPVYLSWSRLTG